MSVATASVLLLTSLVLMERTSGVSSQPLTEVDSYEAPWSAPKHIVWNEELLQKLLDYMTAQRMRSEYLRNRESLRTAEDYPPIQENALETPRKRACFNVLDACCMFNLKGCDRFNKKRVKSRMQ